MQVDPQLVVLYAKWLARALERVPVNKLTPAERAALRQLEHQIRAVLRLCELDAE